MLAAFEGAADRASVPGVHLGKRPAPGPAAAAGAREGTVRSIIWMECRLTAAAAIRLVEERLVQLPALVECWLIVGVEG